MQSTANKINYTLKISQDVHKITKAFSFSPLKEPLKVFINKQINKYPTTIKAVILSGLRCYVCTHLCTQLYIYMYICVLSLTFMNILLFT